ncbi:unnamed protein product, partial [Ascophyllum nodosum]
MRKWLPRAYGTHHNTASTARDDKNPTPGGGTRNALLQRRLRSALFRDSFRAGL